MNWGRNVYSFSWNFNSCLEEFFSILMRERCISLTSYFKNSALHFFSFSKLSLISYPYITGCCFNQWEHSWEPGISLGNEFHPKATYSVRLHLRKIIRQDSNGKIFQGHKNESLSLLSWKHVKTGSSCNIHIDDCAKSVPAMQFEIISLFMFYNIL